MIAAWRRRLGLSGSSGADTDDEGMEEEPAAPGGALSNLVGRARKAVAEHRNEEAEELFTEAIDKCEANVTAVAAGGLPPDDAAMKMVTTRRNGYLLWLYCCRSHVRVGLAKGQLALEDAQLALDRNPSFTTAHMRKVEALCALNMPFEALRACNAGLETNACQKELLEYRDQAMADIALLRHVPEPDEEKHASPIDEDFAEQQREAMMEQQCVMQDLVAVRKGHWQKVRVTGGGTSDVSPSPRHAHACAAVGHAVHAMFVFGGYGDKGVRLNDLHQFDLPSRTWNEHTQRQGQPEAPSPRHSAAMVADTAQMSLWLFGGTTAEGPSNELYRYDLLTKRWSSLPKPGPQAASPADEEGGPAPVWPSERWGHDLAFCPKRSRLYLFGGKSLPGHAQVTNDLWAFDTRDLTWTRLHASLAANDDEPDLPQHRQFHKLLCHRDSLYLLGGFFGARNLSSLHRYDLVENRWDLVEARALSIRSFAAVVHGSDIYAVCGSRGEHSSRDTFRVPLSGGPAVLLETSTAPAPRHFLTAVKWNNSIWAFGGFSTRNFNDVHRFFLEDPTAAGDAAGGHVGLDLASLIDNESFHDVTFVLQGGETVRAHKAILSARCERFRGMFTSGMVESKYQAAIEVPTVRKPAFLSLMHWLYTGRLDSGGTDQAIQMLQLADEYLVEDLKVHCSFILQRVVDDSCAEDLLQIAEVCNAPQLAAYCKSFLL
mmetsp:Transcript_207/g.706  ORF Transcript_207/g.706 Transcript_207/m.706 type:complete len:714 (+) Transcript_207:176-2317(+)